MTIFLKPIVSYRVFQKSVPEPSIRKLPQKRSHQSIYPSNSKKKKKIINNINICKYILQNIFE